MLKKIRYWLEYIACLGLYYTFKVLPMPVASLLGGKLFRAIGFFCVRLNRVSHTNLRLAFPDLNYLARSKIVSKMWEHFGRVVAEMPHWATIDEVKTRHIVEFIGANEITSEECILISGHFGNWEATPIIARMLGLKLHLVYRKANNTLVDNLINKGRIAQGVKLIPKGISGMRDMIKVIHNKKQALGMLVDQKLNEGESINFFGHPALTTLAPANLALRYGAPIITAFVRRKEGINYESKFKALPIEKDSSAEDIMSQINNELEAAIRDAPEQWFWFHKRWSKEIYARK